MKQDIFGKTPAIGATIVFTAPKYKSLEHGKIVGFGNTGCPRIIGDIEKGHMWFEWRKHGYYTVKTDFVIVE